MTSYFNLLKYAATGQASPDMTYYDKLRASTLMGGVVQTLTGIPPLSFKSDGSPLISWSMKGNGSQTGTPTPDAPIMPEFCGVRTANLISLPTVTATIDGLTVSSNAETMTISGNATTTLESNSAWKQFDFTLEAGEYTLSLGSPRAYQSGYAPRLYKYDDGSVICDYLAGGSISSVTFTLSEKTHVYLAFYITDKQLSNDKWVFMLNLGSTALPYEPYGYKIPISCGGETTTVYLGEVPTVRRVKKFVLDGTETWVKSRAYQGSFYVQIVTGILSETYTAYCTHLAFSALSQYEKGKFCFNGGAIKNCNLWINEFDSNTTVADFKAYLASEYAAGHPVCVWYVLANEQTGIVNEPLCKIGTYADALHSTDAAVTIPTAKGQNTLTVDTPIQPSEMTITYKG